MKRYLRILKPTKVYSRHELSSSHLTTLEPDTIISFNREKRRDKVNWMEIYIEDKKEAYIKKDHDNFYKCQNVILDDDSVQGFSVIYKTSKKPLFDSLFHQKDTLTEIENIGIIKAESIEDAKEGKKIDIQLAYNKDLIQVDPFVLKKKEHFYIINNVFGKKYIFIEIDNLKGKKGFILKKTNYTKKGDEWMKPVIVIIMILVVGGLILIGLSAGWLAISGLMLIPAVIVAIVAIVVLQIILMIIKGIFNIIRKRF
ncbi:hypothetical protein [Psychroserpens sp. NJDZ02]|uniref:hypothetical protein n=1 Tax=Psychroserpens sp. NJDZ02 TaxID=2570561 RepID=UPI0010A85CC3|nr:hypothetical protein [Psychroserpens sp. NJDZ02]QCE39931.1 hypothetical protein E9099_00275 [Psychroserpens sp. NJDZ02]